MKPSPIADAYVGAEQREQPQPCYPLDLYLCRNCGHVQLLDVVSPEALFSNYIYVTAKSPALVEHFRLYAGELLRRCPPPRSGLAIDIGSNDGTLLGFLRRPGLRVLGIDPAATIAATATRRGIETVPGFFTAAVARAIRLKYGCANCMTANNVFAHCDNLADMADAVRELLAPDGVFVFEVSYLVDILDKLLFDTIYHEHLSYHAITPLVVFLAGHGLDLFDVERVPSKGGSIRCWVQSLGGIRARTPRVERLMALESELGLLTPAAFREVTRRINAAKDEFYRVVRSLCSNGTGLPGYGASATVTTLIYNFELGDFLDCLLDDDPQRVGLMSPGLHLPVLSSDTLLKKRPRGAVILAWQYTERIIGRNQQYLAEGGHFAIPLPQAHVI